MNPLQELYPCVIVDDDIIDRLTTISFVKKYSFLNVAASFENSTEALAYSLNHKIDILFLDIDMPNMNGLELRKKLAHIDVVVFITSHAEYALESFEISAFDFIVKPIRAERFAKTMERIETYLTLKHKAELLDTSLGGDAIFIKQGHEQIKLQLHQILYFEALKDYTRIVTTTKKYCVLNTLGNLIKEVTFSSFVRIHRSFAVQRNFVEKMNTNEVILQGNIVLPIGRSYKIEAEKLFN